MNLFEVRHHIKACEMTDKKAEAIKLKNEGNKAFKGKDYDKALDHYNNAIKLNPNEVSSAY